jgi:hypothetical protein
VQVDPVKPMLKAPKSKLLKLHHRKVLSNRLFRFDLRRYSEVALDAYDLAEAAEAAAAANGSGAVATVNATAGALATTGGKTPTELAVRSVENIVVRRCRLTPSNTTLKRLELIS